MFTLRHRNEFIEESNLPQQQQRRQRRHWLKSKVRRGLIAHPPAAAPGTKNVAAQQSKWSKFYTNAYILIHVKAKWITTLKRKILPECLHEHYVLALSFAPGPSIDLPSTKPEGRPEDNIPRHRWRWRLSCLPTYNEVDRRRRRRRRRRCSFRSWDKLTVDVENRRRRRRRRWVSNQRQTVALPDSQLVKCRLEHSTNSIRGIKSDMFGV